MSEERLQKYLAACGVASRRRAEELIRQGRVAVNGFVVQELGTKVNPAADVVTLDGQVISRRETPVYVVLHKPPGVLSTVRDERGRRTVRDLTADIKARIYPVGRLDADSEGLVLLTNDGALAARLMHPRHHVPKVYHVVVQGHPAAEALDRLAHGVELEDGPTLPARVKVLRRLSHATELRIELREGRNRQIRRMCEAVGHSVMRLVRTHIGPLALGDLPPAKWRYLTPAEVAALQRAAGLRPGE